VYDHGSGDEIVDGAFAFVEEQDYDLAPNPHLLQNGDRTKPRWLVFLQQVMAG